MDGVFGADGGVSTTAAAGVVVACPGGGRTHPARGASKVAKAKAPATRAKAGRGRGERVNMMSPLSIPVARRGARLRRAVTASASAAPEKRPRTARRIGAHFR